MRISDWSSDVCASDLKEILDYLKAENAYFETAMEPPKPLVRTLFEEMKGRIKEDDKSVPKKYGDFLYWREFETGTQYRNWFRRPVHDGESQIMLVEPALQAGMEYFILGAIQVSPEGR